MSLAGHGTLQPQLNHNQSGYFLPGKADGDEGALENVLADARQIEKLVEPDIGGEMQAGVKALRAVFLGF